MVIIMMNSEIKETQQDSYIIGNYNDIQMEILKQVGKSDLNNPDFYLQTVTSRIQSISQDYISFRAVNKQNKELLDKLIKDQNPNFLDSLDMHQLFALMHIAEYKNDIKNYISCKRIKSRGSYNIGKYDDIQMEILKQVGKSDLNNPDFYLQTVTSRIQSISQDYISFRAVNKQNKELLDKLIKDQNPNFLDSLDMHQLFALMQISDYDATIKNFITTKKINLLIYFEVTELLELANQEYISIDYLISLPKDKHKLLFNVLSDYNFFSFDYLNISREKKDEFFNSFTQVQIPHEFVANYDNNQIELVPYDNQAPNFSLNVTYQNQNHEIKHKDIHYRIATHEVYDVVESFRQENVPAVFNNPNFKIKVQNVYDYQDGTSVEICIAEDLTYRKLESLLFNHNVTQSFSNDELNKIYNLDFIMLCQMHNTRTWVLNPAFKDLSLALSSVGKEKHISVVNFIKIYSQLLKCDNVETLKKHANFLIHVSNDNDFANAIIKFFNLDNSENILSGEFIEKVQSWALNPSSKYLIKALNFVNTPGYITSEEFMTIYKIVIQCEDMQTVKQNRKFLTKIIKNPIAARNFIKIYDLLDHLSKDKPEVFSQITREGQIYEAEFKIDVISLFTEDLSLTQNFSDTKIIKAILMHDMIKNYDDAFNVICWLIKFSPKQIVILFEKYSADQTLNQSIINTVVLAALYYPSTGFISIRNYINDGGMPQIFDDIISNKKDYPTMGHYMYEAKDRISQNLVISPELQRKVVEGQKQSQLSHAQREENKKSNTARRLF